MATEFATVSVGATFKPYFAYATSIFVCAIKDIAYATDISRALLTRLLRTLRGQNGSYRSFRLRYRKVCVHFGFAYATCVSFAYATSIPCC